MQHLAFGVPINLSEALLLLLVPTSAVPNYITKALEEHQMDLPLPQEFSNAPCITT